MIEDDNIEAAAAGTEPVKGQVADRVVAVMERLTDPETAAAHEGQVRQALSLARLTLGAAWVDRLAADVERAADLVEAGELTSALALMTQYGLERVLAPHIQAQRDVAAAFRAGE